MNMSVFLNTPRSSGNTNAQEIIYEKKKETKLPQIIKLAAKTPKLQLNFTQALALPDISRMHTPTPRKISPILAHVAENPPQTEKQLINLEKLVQREEKLSILQDTLNNDMNIGNLCSEYWELSSDEALWGVDKLFKDSRTRKFLSDALIVESLAIALMIFCSNHITDRSNIANQIKNMIYFLHQNFLTIVDLVLSKLPASTPPTAWVQNLKDTLKNKKLKAVKRSEHATYLKQHNEIISNCLRTIIRLLPIKTTPSLSMLMHILSNRDKFSISVARSYVFQEPASVDCSIIPPYLPETSDKEYTLVLDLDETLVHYSIQGTTGQLLVRPFCSEFLEELDKYYELVVFTAGLQEVKLI